jgi:hypothetical protein
MGAMIKLNQHEPVKIAHLRGQNAVARKLHVSGKGTLFVCLLAFYNEGEHHTKHKELYFRHVDYTSAKEIPPVNKGFAISDYDYCIIRILTGSLSPEDEIFLSYQCEA